MQDCIFELFVLNSHDLVENYLYPHFTDRRFSGDHGVYDASTKRHEARQKRLGMPDFAVLGNTPRFLHACITLVKISVR